MGSWGVKFYQGDVNTARLLQEVANFTAANLASFTAAGFGAFLGSGSAFLLESRRRKSERRDKEHDAALSAQYALQAQWNTLEGVRRQCLEPLRNDPHRHLNIAVFTMPGPRLSIPFDRLIFIAKRDDPNLLQEMRIAEESYVSAMEVLSQRNAKVEAFYYDSDVDRKTFNEETGRSTSNAPAHKVFLIKQLTDGLYHHVDRAIPLLAAAFASTRVCIKRNFPRKFRALGTTEYDTASPPIQ